MDEHLGQRVDFNSMYLLKQILFHKINRFFLLMKYIKIDEGDIHSRQVSKMKPYEMKTYRVKGQISNKIGLATRSIGNELVFSFLSTIPILGLPLSLSFLKKKCPT